MMRLNQILVVSEDHGMRRLIEGYLEAEGHQAVCVSFPHQALDLLSKGITFTYVLLDAARNRCRDTLFGSALLSSVSHERLCIVSEAGDFSWRDHAKKWRIDKVLTKPILRGDMQRLVSGDVSEQSASAIGTLPSELSSSAFHLEELDNDTFFLAASPSMMRIYRNVRILSRVDHPVLILGESGVGKEIVARLLHKYHARSTKEFLNVNCAALPADLLESELFGYEAGAFTGASKSKPGKFEMADKGTLLLDEIGEMSPQMQAKLLHVLQDGSFSRLGARSTTRVDVRVLAATNVNMEDAIAEKRFREDLYYRLSAFTITIPPLRERREEIPPLIEAVIQRGAAQLGCPPVTFPRELMEAVQEYDWPGNLRELRNFVTRRLVLDDMEVALQDLRGKTRSRATSAASPTASRVETEIPIPPGMKNVVNGIKNETEIRMIQQALSASGWNRRRAANDLNISYRTLLYKIQRHGLRA
jgi:two-component system response regulator AtoC